jgi:ketosteroid isomerase-like protein
MLSWLGGKLVRYQMAALNAGNIKPSLRMDARDVEMTFPGDSSWGRVYRGKREHREFLERFVAAGLQIFADEVIVKGTPWRATVCIRGHDQAEGPQGERVYDNRYVIWGRLVWGRLKQYEVYEDTVKTNVFDEWLERREQQPALAS